MVWDTLMCTLYMVNRVHTYLCITMKDTAAIVSPIYSGGQVFENRFFPSVQVQNRFSNCNLPSK